MAIVLANRYMLSIGELFIESATVEDAENIISFIKQVEIETDFLLREADEFNMTLENEKSFIDSKRNNEKEIFLAAKINGKIVGTLGFASSPYNRCKHKGQFGIAISKDFWGYGIGCKMLSLLVDWADRSGLTKITLEVDSNNERAIALYRKFGFEEEGLLKYDKYMGNGSYRDSIVMARINHHNPIV
jgi:RimJ/RimL family protein N-acetyltransferase